MEWRCFNCGDIFTDRAKAQEHFGYRSIEPPLCAADLQELKTMRVEMHNLRQETKMAKPTKERIEELEKQREQLQRLLDHARHTNDPTPRWIADMATMELSERQPDNSYKPSYRMAPLTN